MGDEGARVLRRCPKCRLLFEVTEGNVHCLVCGDSVEGLALPLQSGSRMELRDDSVPIEVGDHEVTERLQRRR